MPLMPCHGRVLFAVGSSVKRNKSPRHKRRAVATVSQKNNSSHPSHPSHLSPRNVICSILGVTVGQRRQGFRNWSRTSTMTNALRTDARLPLDAERPPSSAMGYLARLSNRGAGGKRAQKGQILGETKPLSGLELAS